MRKFDYIGELQSEIEIYNLTTMVIKKKENKY